MLNFDTITDSNHDPAKDSERPLLNEVKVQAARKARNPLKGTGWRGGIVYCIIAGLVVLFANIILAVWASKQRLSNGGISTLYQGSCQKATYYTMVSHVVVNALSTMLIGAGNYCMHILISPTRSDIDHWHCKKTVLSIGVNSLRNLFKVNRARRLGWLCLALTSIPLHLMFNSIIISTKSAYAYTAAVAGPSFFQGRSFNNTEVFDLPETTPSWDSWMSSVQRNHTTLQYLDNTACVAAYAREFVTDRANLLLMADPRFFDLEMQRNSSVIAGYYVDMDLSGGGDSSSTMSYNWMCSKGIGEGGWGIVPACSYFISNSDQFSILIGAQSSWSGLGTLGCGHVGDGCTNVTIDYCLSQQMPELCSTEAVLPIIYVVISLAFVKSACMCWILFGMKEQPLVVLGDALASFMQSPDPCTQKACLLPKDAFGSRASWQGARSFTKKKQPWGCAVSMSRWVVCCALCLLTIVVAIGLLCMGINTLKGNNKYTAGYPLSSAFSSPLGSIDPRFIITFGLLHSEQSAAATLGAVLVANLPQLLVSFVYFTYNGIFTGIIMAVEWSRLTRQRKPLRVTDPVGAQRSTYRLQLPYRYSIPLMIFITTLHFLVSESFFVVRLRIYDFNGNMQSDGSFVTCGYSLLAVVVAITVGVLAVLILISFGVFPKFDSGVHIVGSSSAAISAACHPRPNEVLGASKLPLQWGAVETESDIGHCCLSTGPVIDLKLGKLYA